VPNPYAPPAAILGTGVEARHGRRLGRRAWLFSGIAYLLPVFAYAEAAREAELQRQTHGWVCGNALMGIFFTAGLTMAVFAVLALASRVAAMSLGWRADRPVLSYLGLAFMSGPLVGGVAFAFMVF
jgi:hypothetical protein